MTFDLAVLNGTIVTGRGRVEADLGVREGRIAAILARGHLPAERSEKVIDARGLAVLPGLIDAHVHLWEPGWPEWEDFPSGTRAAAAGGVTTILEMPLSVPQVDSGEALTDRAAALEGRAVVDFGLYGGLGEANGGAAAGLAEAGAVGFKSFRVGAQHPDPNLQANGVRVPDPGGMLERFRESAATGLVHAVHVEDHDLCRHFTAEAKRKGLRRPEHHNLGRPELCEILSTAETLTLAREARARLHLVHMSAPEAIEMAARAKAAGQAVTVETVVHYLLFTSADMPRLGPYGKVTPPLRSRESQARLWDLIRNGSIDIIATDHAPFAVEEKEATWDDIWAAPDGAPGLDTMLPALLTQVQQGRLSLERLVALTSENPARIFGLYPRKGSLHPGADADLVLVDLDREHVLRAADFFSKGRAVARMYDGMAVRGMPVATIVRGTVVYDRGEIVVEPGHGRFIRPVATAERQDRASAVV